MSDNYPSSPSANMPTGADPSADYERPGQVAQGGGGAAHRTVNEVNADAQAGLVFLDPGHNGLTPLSGTEADHDNRIIAAQAGHYSLPSGDGSGPSTSPNKFGGAFDPKRRELAGPG